MTTYVSHSVEETQKFAAGFAKKLKGGDFVALVGELGTGKTTFVRAVAHALGVKTLVKSPTFTLMHVYPVSYGKIKRLVHVDFYRGKDKEMGLEEYEKDDAVIFVEWPEERQKPSWTVLFEHGEEPCTRRLTIQQHGTLRQHS